MTSSRKILLTLALAVVALAQTSVLAYMVIDRVSLLKNGREITLPIVPVDPRDLFKGEFVRLGFEISRLPRSLLEGAAPEDQGGRFFVTLEKKADGIWNAVKVTRDAPAEAGPDRIVLKARSAPARWSDAWISLHYGIEGYFVPQGQGPKLEAMARSRKLAVLVAVDKGGNAAIKGLIIDGQLQYEEPLF